MSCYPGLLHHQMFILHVCIIYIYIYVHTSMLYICNIYIDMMYLYVYTQYIYISRTHNDLFLFERSDPIRRSICSPPLVLSKCHNGEGCNRWTPIVQGTTLQLSCNILTSYYDWSTNPTPGPRTLLRNKAFY